MEVLNSIPIKLDLEDVLKRMRFPVSALYINILSCCVKLVL